MFSCAKCNVHACSKNLEDKKPGLQCPSKGKKHITEKSIEKYKTNEEDHKLAYNSALVESEGYCKDVRLLEIINFAKKCGFKKLGIAFCIGLANEAKVVAKIMELHGFDLKSITCKFSGVDKEELGIKNSEKVCPDCFESMCNPIGQAMYLNEEETDFNIMIGLCVGHDSLFFKYSEAPTTVFTVKDRVLGHNPLAAIYTSDCYYKKKLFNN
jgi:uncharacterized metal-binding protein